MRSEVSITKCPDYEQARVDDAVRKSLDLIGGLGLFVKPGDQVLIKVNALMHHSPEEAVTTHPSLVSAVVKEVKRLGANPIVGDSPGDPRANIHRVMEVTGIKRATEEAGGEIVYFEEHGILEVPSPSRNQRIKKINIFNSVLNADLVINLPKLKTHNFTLMTAAIKNMFGSVPGFHKSRYHILAPRPHQFAESLVDILEITRPALHIVDAIIGMEGHGPSAGKPRSMGAILASTDAVAIDAVCASAIGYRPLQIETTKAAFERGLGEARLEKIDIKGASLEEITKKDWEHSSNIHSLTRFLPDPLLALLRPIADQLRIDPFIIQDKCKKCLVCVENCPAKTIHYKNGTVRIDLKNCIMCYCCSELCPYGAIRLKRSWLAKLLGIGAS